MCVNTSSPGVLPFWLFGFLVCLPSFLEQTGQLLLWGSCTLQSLAPVTMRCAAWLLPVGLPGSNVNEPECQGANSWNLGRNYRSPCWPHVMSRGASCARAWKS
eukprot:s3074_g4.t1